MGYDAGAAAPAARVLLAAACALLLAAVAWRLPSGAWVVGPGTVVPADRLVMVTDGVSAGAGGPSPLRVLTVAARPATLGAAALAAVDPGRAVWPASALLQPGETPADLARRARAEWQRSGRLALAVAQRHLGRPVAARFPDAGLGGPSAGLALALEIVRQSLPADHGRSHPSLLGVTGALDAQGRVLPVAGVALKARAAAAAGVRVLLVPAGLEGEAGRAAPQLRVVGVRHFADAVREALTAAKGDNYNGSGSEGGP